MRLGKHRTSVLLRNKLLSKNWKMGIFDHIKFLSITCKNKISLRKKKSMWYEKCWEQNTLTGKGICYKLNCFPLNSYVEIIIPISQDMTASGKSL